MRATAAVSGCVRHRMVRLGVCAPLDARERCPAMQRQTLRRAGCETRWRLSACAGCPRAAACTAQRPGVRCEDGTMPLSRPAHVRQDTALLLAPLGRHARAEHVSRGGPNRACSARASMCGLGGGASALITQCSPERSEVRFRSDAPPRATPGLGWICGVRQGWSRRAVANAPPQPPGPARPSGLTSSDPSGRARPRRVARVSAGGGRAGSCRDERATAEPLAGPSRKDLCIICPPPGRGSDCAVHLVVCKVHLWHPGGTEDAVPRTFAAGRCRPYCCAAGRHARWPGLARALQAAVWTGLQRRAVARPAATCAL